MGIIAQDYENDKVADIDDLYKGIRILEGVSQEAISKLYELPDGVDAARIQPRSKYDGPSVFYYEK